MESESRTPTRRRMLGTALAAAAVPLLAVPAARAAAPPPARLTLPAPTGPHPVGTTPLHLVDAARGNRELMASAWYPARRAPGAPLAPWLTEGALRPFLSDAGYPLDPALGPLTAGRLRAPVLRAGPHPLPTVVYSHGAHSHRGDHTVIVQELASRGYLVVTVDHTDDAYTEFPDGRVLTPSDDPARAMGPKDFAADIRFVLDRVDGLAAGRNPDADGRPLPAGLAGAPDPHRIGMFGWSKGGTATVYAMLGDRRVRAGLSLDGPMQPRVTEDLDRPFLMMTADFTRAAEPDVAAFWTRLRGWRLNVRAVGAVHNSYGDNEVLIPQAGRLLGMTEAQIEEQIGTLDPAQGVRIQQAYPAAFFDRQLRGRRARLLDGPSRAFPEVDYLP